VTPIAAKFADLKTRGERALVLFVTAGDPRLGDLPGILEALEEGGADLIEIGIPFSDPIADGPTIQASTQRALDQGVTPSQICESLAAHTPKVPLVAMGYYNTVLRLGLTQAAAALGRAHVGGTILSDLTPEEADEWREASRAADLDTIFLASPTSTDARLNEVCRSSTGFVYAVSRTGVTSAQVSVSREAGDLVSRIKGRTDLPVCVGFGVSKPEHVRMVCEVADGAVVGSWLVDLLHREWRDGVGKSKVVELIRALKEATRA